MFNVLTDLQFSNWASQTELWLTGAKM